MKLTRRTFLGLLSSLVATPLVAKDMGDFDFLPPLLKEPVLPFLPTSSRPSGVIGQIRYNMDIDCLEVFTSAGWQILEDPLEKVS